MRTLMSWKKKKKYSFQFDTEKCLSSIFIINDRAGFISTQPADPRAVRQPCHCGLDALTPFNRMSLPRRPPAGGRRRGRGL